jgi:LacI family transcriptional regulator
LGPTARASSTPVQRGVLAWIDASAANAPGMRKIFHPLWAGAAGRAESLGWDLQEFRLNESGLSQKKFSDMLRMRGIEGLLVAPMPGQGGPLALQWASFSAITIGHTLTSPRLHRVAPHQVHNIQLLLRELATSGYRRPGLVISPQRHERTQHYWMAGFLAAQLELPRADRLPPCVREFDTPGRFIAWYRRHRPDVILSGKLETTMAMLRDAGIRVPEEVAVAGTGLDYPAAGIDEDFHNIGTVAIDTLVGLIHRHERGVPTDAMHILLEGRWKPGATLRPGPTAKPVR